VSRFSPDVVGSDRDRSSEPVFIKAREAKIYYGPVSFRKDSEPYLTMAVSHGGRGGVTVADINLKLVGEIISSLKVGETGYGYIVDGTGRLISHPDIKLVLRGTNSSALPQVAAALAGPPSAEPVDGQSFGVSGPRQSVRSVHVGIPALGWHVFVDLPTAETGAAFWSALIRGISLLGLGLVAAVLGLLLALRPVTISRAAAA
jgi:hypothetical protein